MSQSGRFGASIVPPVSGIGTLTGNTGGAVGPDGGNNINVVGTNVISVAGNAGTHTETIALTNGTNGQVLIGGGAAPVWANITSTGATIAITNGANTINIETTGTALSYTNVATTPYVVLANDYYLSVDCSGGPITVELPNAPTASKVYIIKDRTGNASTNAITVTTVGGTVLIDGAPSYNLNATYGAIQVIFNGTGYEIY